MRGLLRGFWGHSAAPAGSGLVPDMGRSSVTYDMKSVLKAREERGKQAAEATADHTKIAKITSFFGKNSSSSSSSSSSVSSSSNNNRSSSSTSVPSSSSSGSSSTSSSSSTSTSSNNNRSSSITSVPVLTSTPGIAWASPWDSLEADNDHDLPELLDLDEDPDEDQYLANLSDRTKPLEDRVPDGPAPEWVYEEVQRGDLPSSSDIKDEDVAWWKKRCRSIRGMISVFGFLPVICEELYYKYGQSLEISREGFSWVLMVLKLDPLYSSVSYITRVDISPTSFWTKVDGWHAYWHPCFLVSIGGGAD